MKQPVEIPSLLERANDATAAWPISSAITAIVGRHCGLDREAYLDAALMFHTVM